MTDSVQLISSGRKRIAKLLDAVTTTQISGNAAIANVSNTFQATVSGTGAVSATVVIEFSNDGVGWVEGATITLSGTTSDSDGFVSDAPWVYARANLSAISGTGAAVTVTMGG